MAVDPHELGSSQSPDQKLTGEKLEAALQQEADILRTQIWIRLEDEGDTEGESGATTLHLRKGDSVIRLSMPDTLVGDVSLHGVKGKAAHERRLYSSWHNTPGRPFREIRFADEDSEFQATMYSQRQDGSQRSLEHHDVIFWGKPKEAGFALDLYHAPQEEGRKQAALQDLRTIRKALSEVGWKKISEQQYMSLGPNANTRARRPS